MFDPLAVMLVIAYNQALLQNKPKEKTQNEHWKDIYSQPTLIDEEPKKPKKPVNPNKLPKPVLGRGARIPNKSN